MRTLLDAKTRPMTEDESKMFLHLYMHEREDRGELIHKSMIENELFSLMVLDKRLEVASKVKSTPAIRVFCSILANGSPGKAVQWAFALHIMGLRTQKEVCFDNFVNFFPMGIPTEEEMEEIWDSQKAAEAPLGNLLDTEKAWDEAK